MRSVFAGVRDYDYEPDFAPEFRIGGDDLLPLSKLSERAALATSGSLPKNVNYAVKSIYLLIFMESVPELAAKLKEPETKE